MTIVEDSFLSRYIKKVEQEHSSVLFEESSVDVKSDDHPNEEEKPNLEVGNRSEDYSGTMFDLIGIRKEDDETATRMVCTFLDDCEKQISPPCLNNPSPAVSLLQDEIPMSSCDVSVLCPQTEKNSKEKSVFEVNESPRSIQETSRSPNICSESESLVRGGSPVADTSDADSVCISIEDSDTEQRCESPLSNDHRSQQETAYPSILEVSSDSSDVIVSVGHSQNDSPYCSQSSEEDAMIANYVLSCSQNTPLHSQPVWENHSNIVLSKRPSTGDVQESAAKRSETWERTLFSQSSDSNECENPQNFVPTPDSPPEVRESQQDELPWSSPESDNGDNVPLSQSTRPHNTRSHKVKFLHCIGI